MLCRIMCWLYLKWLLHPTCMLIYQRYLKIADISQNGRICPMLRGRSVDTQYASLTTHFNTMSSQWAPWRLKSPASPVFAQPFVQAHIKENTKALRDCRSWLQNVFSHPVYSAWQPILRQELVGHDVLVTPSISLEQCKSLGAVSIRKTVLPGMAIPMLKIRRPNGRLIFNMEIAIRR